MGKPVIRSHYSHAIRLGRLKRAIARARDIKMRCGGSHTLQELKTTLYARIFIDYILQYQSKELYLLHYLLKEFYRNLLEKHASFYK